MKLKTMLPTLAALVLLVSTIATASADGWASYPWGRNAAMQSEEIFVYFMVNGGETQVDPAAVTADGFLQTVPSCERTGYEFSGWFFTKDGDKVQVSTSTKFEESTFVTAEWKPLQVNIVYQDKGGATFSGTNHVSNPSSHTYGVESVIRDATRVGHIFKGWYLTADCSGEPVTSLEATAHLKTITLYALWEEVETLKYTVSFLTDGGSSVERQEIEENGYAIRPENPTREGYTFLGWYGEDGKEFNFDLTRIKENKVLTAQWERIVFYTTGHVTDFSGKVIEGAEVYLRQRGELVDYITTTSTGSYTFEDVEAGVYNIYIAYGNKGQTIAVDLGSGHNGITAVALPEMQLNVQGHLNSVCDFLVVHGLSYEGDVLAQGEYDLGKVTVDFYAEPIEDAQSQKLFSSVVASTTELQEYFSLEIQKTATDAYSRVTKSTVTETDTLLQLVLEVENPGKNPENYELYRIHNDILEVLTQVENSAGERIELSADGKYLSIYLHKLGNFALGYRGNGSSGAVVPEGNVTHYELQTRVYLDGELTNRTHMGTVEFSTYAPQSGDLVLVNAVPNYGYEVDEILVYNDKGAKLYINQGNDGAYRYVQENSQVTVAVYFVRSSGSASNQVSYYDDVKADDSFCQAVNIVTDLGLMTGTGTGKFSPYDSLTRGMLVSILYNLSGETVKHYSSFGDVSQQDYYAYGVAWAEEKGIVSGYADGTFRPNQSISREELAIIFYQYAKVQGLDQSVWVFPSQFTDVSSIHSWAMDAVIWCVNQKVLVPRTGNFFYPQAISTRAEVAVALMALI